MAFLHPHFDPDVFVSYSHGDPDGDGDSPLKNWTHALIRRLKKEIRSLDTEFDNLVLWTDEHKDPTTHLTDELKAKVSASGVLMIVLSKRYLGSSWCRDELQWFAEQIKDREGDVGRVFVLRLQRTDASAWPEFLRDERGHAMPGFSFVDPSNDDQPYGWPDLRDTDRSFTKELSGLRTALTRRLRELKERAERRAHSALARTGPVLPPLGKRQIYLHAASEPVRADIRGLLSPEGIEPVTAPSENKDDMAGWQRDGALRMNLAKRCEALALVRAEGDDNRFKGDVFEIGIDERRRIVGERGTSFPCAVLDRTGSKPPFDLAPWDIEHFDLNKDGWRDDFRQWLDVSRSRPVGAGL